MKIILLLIITLAFYMLEPKIKIFGIVLNDSIDLEINNSTEIEKKLKKNIDNLK